MTGVFLENKKEFYKRIKLAGFISFIPLTLILGPLTGYLAGDFLSKKFLPCRYTVLACVLAGLGASIAEVFRIIRAIIKIEKG
jgi:hypothetical protein